MGLVVLDVSMSLDGFITGPNDDLERVHDWMFQDRSATGRSGQVIDEFFKTTGAIVMGRQCGILSMGRMAGDRMGGPRLTACHSRCRFLS